ncbi:hypothetical protein ACIPO9_02770 [Pseudomonas sp. NPDC090203]|uniref:hypothetical protein n=1 Tax=Pseudomonas sp. NPDC090203 TaxID=3364477 RepID=UPI003805AC39
MFNDPSSDSIYALVATTGYLLLVDLIKKTVTPIENARPEYYGISWQPQSDHLILSHSGVDNAAMLGIADYATSEKGFISSGELSSSNILSAPHQILCASDRRIVCTNTGRNAVTVLQIEKPGHYQEQQISSARWDRLSTEQITGDHLNSVFERDGRIYVLAHGHHKGATLAVMDYPSLEILELQTIGNRTGLHNIWVTDEGQKISCHSNIGSLIDLTSDDVIWSAGNPIYTRGLAATTDYLVVGESQMTGRDLRRSSMSGLWIVDRHTYQTLDYMCLGPYGAVNEVRLLNVADLAHHGHVFQGMSQLLERSLFARQRESSLHASKLAAFEVKAWTDYESVLGVPARSEGGVRTADPQGLCIITRKSADASSVDFHYTLDTTNEASHVSVVLYQGNGSDTEMHALLLQPQDQDHASLGMWSNDGVQWSADLEVRVPDLPLRGHIQAIREHDTLKIVLNGRLLLTLTAEQLPMMAGSMGIRWIGASISPATN